MLLVKSLQSPLSIKEERREKLANKKFNNTLGTVNNEDRYVCDFYDDYLLVTCLFPHILFACSHIPKQGELTVNKPMTATCFQTSRASDIQTKPPIETPQKNWPTLTQLSAAAVVDMLCRTHRNGHPPKMHNHHRNLQLRIPWRPRDPWRPGKWVLKRRHSRQLSPRTQPQRDRWQRRRQLRPGSHRRRPRRDCRKRQGRRRTSRSQHRRSDHRSLRQIVFCK